MIYNEEAIKCIRDSIMIRGAKKTLEDLEEIISADPILSAYVDLLVTTTKQLEEDKRQLFGGKNALKDALDVLANNPNKDAEYKAIKFIIKHTNNIDNDMKLSLTKRAYEITGNPEDTMNYAKALYDSEMYDDAIKLYEKCGFAQYELAQIYISGKGTTKNIKKGLELLVESCYQKNQKALDALRALDDEIRDKELFDIYSKMLENTFLELPKEIKKYILFDAGKRGYSTVNGLKRLFSITGKLCLEVVEEFLRFSGYGLYYLTDEDEKLEDFSVLLEIQRLFEKNNMYNSIVPVFDLSFLEFVNDGYKNNKFVHSPAEAALFLDIKYEDAVKQSALLELYLTNHDACKKARAYYYKMINDERKNEYLSKYSLTNRL